MRFEGIVKCYLLFLPEYISIKAFEGGEAASDAGVVDGIVLFRLGYNGKV